MMEWYEELDFEENPFSADPRENHDKLVMMDDITQEMLYRVTSGSMLVIEGSQGSGRTTLLMIAAKKFGGQKKVAYVDCRVLDQKLNITKLLQNRYGVMGKLLNKKPRDMVVLMDNVETLSKSNTERLKYYFDQNYIRSIVFTTENYKKAKFSDSLRDRIGERMVKIPSLNEDDAIEIVRNRIGNNEIFNEELIKKIFKLSNNSPKQLLENCGKVADSAVRKSRKRAQMADLNVLKSEKK
jgi:Cdc6-like AAA superfamily ATPase